MQPSEINAKLPELHDRLYKLLEAFVDVCERNELNYFMIGGTTLGAVRHKGFIPWDDDIDIAMPRKDYEKFLKIASRALPHPYEIRNFKTHPHGHVYSWTKVEDRNTSLIVNWTAHLNYASGIFIDLFPLDGCPKNKYISALHLRSIFYLKKLFMYSYAKSDCRQTSFIRYYTIGILKRTWIFRCTIYQLLHWLLTRYSYSKSAYVGNFLGEYDMRERMPKAYFGDGCQLPFGETCYRNPALYDSYLKQLYGNNYMEIPPKERQTSLHEFSMLDLETPNH